MKNAEQERNTSGAFRGQQARKLLGSASDRLEVPYCNVAGALALPSGFGLFQFGFNSVTIPRVAPSPVRVRAFKAISRIDLPMGGGSFGAKYTSGQMLQKRHKNCHFVPLFEPPGAIPPCRRSIPKLFGAREIGRR